ncbi:MAG TPA: hypothetical protein VHT97_00815 [Acidimicrobiales bacterium]|nr:hypothetical protein [Acidimicrobiales bacterium]
MRSRWRWVIPVLAFAGVLGACGGGGSSGDPVGAGPGAGGDTAAARTVVLQQADMPDGWRGVAHSEDDTERARAAEISTCLGRPDPVTYRSAIVYSPDFSLAQTQVSAIATVLNTPQDAAADLAAIRGPKYGDCVATAFRQDLQRQAPGAQVDTVGSEALPVQSFGDGSVGLRLTADLVYPDHTDRLFADLVYMSKNRTTVSATFFSFTQPFPSTLEQSLVSRMGNRINTA